MASQTDITAVLDQITKQGEAYKSGTPGAREGLMNSCNQLFSTLLHPSESIIWTQWAQPTYSAVLRLASEVQLFEALAADDGKSKSSKSIAEKTNPQTEHTLVARMLRHLAAMGTIAETAQDTFAPTPLALAMTQESFKDSVQLMHDDFNPCHAKATEYFKQIGYTSPPSSSFAQYQYAQNCKGQHLFEYWAKSQPQVGKRFANMMHVWSQGRPKWFQDGYYPVRDRLIEGANGDATFLVDIGGGTGHDISQLQQAFGEELPGKLILQDRPEVIENAEKQLGPEMEKMSHDFLTEQPVKGARAYYLHSIMQDWDDATCQQILRSIVPAMKPGGYSKILINDFVTPNQGAHWLQTSLDWELMAALASRHRTEEEMRALIEGVDGLKVVEIFKHPQSVDGLIEVVLG